MWSYKIQVILVNSLNFSQCSEHQYLIRLILSFLLSSIGIRLRLEWIRYLSPTYSSGYTHEHEQNKLNEGKKLKHGRKKRMQYPMSIDVYHYSLTTLTNRFFCFSTFQTYTHIQIYGFFHRTSASAHRVHLKQMKRNGKGKGNGNEGGEKTFEKKTTTTTNRINSFVRKMWRWIMVFSHFWFEHYINKTHKHDTTYCWSFWVFLRTCNINMKILFTFRFFMD